MSFNFLVYLPRSVALSIDTRLLELMFRELRPSLHGVSHRLSSGQYINVAPSPFLTFKKAIFLPGESFFCNNECHNVWALYRSKFIESNRKRLLTTHQRRKGHSVCKNCHNLTCLGHVLVTKTKKNN